MHLVFYTCSLLLPLGDKKGSFERSISAWQRRRRQWILPTCPARHTSCPRLLLSIGLLPRWTCSVVCIEAAVVCFARRMYTACKAPPPLPLAVPTSAPPSPTSQHTICGSACHRPRFAALLAAIRPSVRVNVNIIHRMSFAAAYLSNLTMHNC